MVQPRIKIHPDGPYEVMAAAEVALVGVELAEAADEAGSAWLCRCGRAESRPVCDGSHLGCFSAESVPAAVPTWPEVAGPAMVRVVRNGPLLCRGLVVDHVDGSQTELGDRLARLCRCGSSGTMPWCDSAHVQEGFTG